MINPSISGDQGTSWAMLVKLIGEQPPSDISIYSFIAERCGLERKTVKMLILGKSYGMSDELLAKDHDITEEVTPIILQHFPGLEHLLK